MKILFLLRAICTAMVMLSVSAQTESRVAQAVCEDSTERFEIVEPSGKTKMRSCDWVAEKKTNWRCSYYPGVRTLCKATCGACSTCSCEALTQQIEDIASKVDKIDDIEDKVNKILDLLTPPTPTPSAMPSATPTLPGPEPLVLTYSSGVNYPTMYGDQFIDGAYVLFHFPFRFGPEMVNVALDGSSTLDLSFEYKLSSSMPDPCPDTKLYLRLRQTASSWFYGVTYGTTELVGPFTTSTQTYSKTFTIADDIVSTAQDGNVYVVDVVTDVAEGDPVCLGTYINLASYEIATNFAYYEP